MVGSVSKLKDIPGVVEVEEVSFSSVDKSLFSERVFGVARDLSEEVRVYRIVYKSSGKKVVGFLVEPRGRRRNLPCIVYNRGGFGEFGILKYPKIFLQMGFFASKGYVVIGTQYPGNDGGEGVDRWGDEVGLKSITDLRKILKQYDRADESRIGMYGHSRGANMVYMLLRKVRWLKAAVCIAGPSDNRFIRVEKFRPGFGKSLKQKFGGGNAEAVKRSAVLWTDEFSKRTPLLLMHGTADWRVNPDDSLVLARELYKHKVPFRLIMFEGGDHSLWDNYFEARKQSLRWFDRFVRDGEKLPNLKPHGG